MSHVVKSVCFAILCFVNARVLNAAKYKFRVFITKVDSEGESH